MNKTILTGIIIVLVAVIGVMAFTGSDNERVTNEVSTTSEQVVDKVDDENQSNNSDTNTNPENNDENAATATQQQFVVRDVSYTVSFCGETYSVNKQVMANNVSVINRIADIASNNPDNLICENVQGNNEDGILEVSVEEDTSYQGDESRYVITGIAGGAFFVDLSRNGIFQPGFAGDKKIGDLAE